MRLLQHPLYRTRERDTLIPSNWTIKINFGLHASGHGIQYCPYFTSGIQRHPNTPIDLLTNKQKWLRFSAPLSAFSDSEKSRECATSVLPSHRSHNIGIKGTPLELATFRGGGGGVSTWCISGATRTLGIKVY
jgi:hypothetical protein